MLRDDLGRLFQSACIDVNQGTVLANLLAQILKCEVVGVIIYGSLAKGTWTKSSDVDALVLATDGDSSGIWDRSNDMELDVYCEQIQKVLTDPPSRWLHLAGGKVVYDRDGRASELLSKINNTANSPAPRLSVEQIRRYEVWSNRMIRRVQENREADNYVLAYFHACDFLTNMFEIYFKLKGLWYLSAKQSLSYFQANDTALLQALDTLSKTNIQDDKYVENMVSIRNTVFNTK